MPQEIPLVPTANQTLTVGLGNQACQIDVYQTQYGLFVDLYVNNQPIILGVLALNRNRIVRDAYLGFDGDLAFNDTQGNADPTYLGLGSQFSLLYFAAGELAEAA